MSLHFVKHLPHLKKPSWDVVVKTTVLEPDFYWKKNSIYLEDDG